MISEPSSTTCQRGGPHGLFRRIHCRAAKTPTPKPPFHQLDRRGDPKEVADVLRTCRLRRHQSRGALCPAKPTGPLASRRPPTWPRIHHEESNTIGPPGRLLRHQCHDRSLGRLCHGRSRRRRCVTCCLSFRIAAGRGRASLGRDARREGGALMENADPFRSFEEVATPSEERSQRRDEWTPIVPIPENIELTPAVLCQLTPSSFTLTTTWRYGSAAGRTMHHVARFDRGSGGSKAAKTIRPICYCEHTSGRKDWRLKA